MVTKLVIFFVVVFAGICYTKDIKATAKINGGSYGIRGDVKFTYKNNGRTEIKGKLKGLRPGFNYGLQIHEYGDISMDCALVGYRFDPYGPQYGTVLGDLMTITANKDGNADFKWDRSQIELDGPYSVVGRSISISLKQIIYDTNGYYEPIMACGVITLDGKKKDKHHKHNNSS